jgi:hypothetical protein
VDGLTETELSSRHDKELPSKSKNLATKAEAQRLMKSKIAAKIAAGFVDAATRRAEQNQAKQALKERIANLKAAMTSSSNHPGTKTKPSKSTKTREKAPTSVKPLPKAAKAPRLPPRSYLEHVRLHGSDGELERKAERSKRRSLKLPGYPGRLVIHPPARLAKMRKIFRSALIPATDLVRPHDHSALIPFADDTERTWMCWDPRTLRADGEMMICFIDGDLGDQRSDAGYDLQKILKEYERTRPAGRRR